ncbi:hypothetical protein ACF1BN_20235 [Streptomyces sp. NPDC014861]|uniref:hypothetical protein n=1 Tax=Streptomyces sp. NPDC014861 TaxID=3364923 RepID=UPI0036FDE83A
MLRVVEELADEAERQVREHVWILSTADHALATQAAAALRALIGPPKTHEKLPLVDRLAALRQALAVLAVTLAHVHGRLAWFLGAAATALTPVLHWRALAPGEGPTFGAVQPTLQQYTDGEDAIRRLQKSLAALTTA